MQYSPRGHGQMISDPIRMEAYEQALRRAVQPGSVVVDLGAGTGVFALLACRYGARRVFAIEQDGIIQVARQLAAANRCADRIEFIQESSDRVSLAEPADVIVSDLYDVTPLVQKRVPSIADARRRFLRPGGALIPQRDTLWAAPVEAPELVCSQTDSSGTTRQELDLALVWRLAANSCRKARVRPEQLLAEPQRWATLDYATVEDPNVRATLNWTISRAGPGHGFILWFDATLCAGVEFSNSPRAPEMIYGSAFFPWTNPIAFHPGDAVSVHLEANLVAEDYIWSWDTCVRERGGRGTTAARFQQSTFYETVLSPASLRKCAADHVPALDDDGRIDAWTLAMMDGRNSLEEIAHRLVEQFPEHFSNEKDALTRAAALSLRYSR